MTSRISTVAVALATLTGVGCGSSTNTTTTAPSSLTRCTVTPTGNGSVPAQGGSGTITVNAARECSWTASVDGAWLSIRSSATGQGDGAVEFSAAANPDPATRRGAIVLNDKRVELMQAAGECVISLAEQGMSVDQGGGSGRVDVRASSQLCTWRAEPDVNWIVLRADPNGRGTASVAFDVMAATGPSRAGSIRVAGHQFTVTQAAGCSYSITPASHAAGASGGSGTVTINTAAGCPWTASSRESWIGILPASGVGPGSVIFTVAATDGAARSGAATIAGQMFAVQQQGSSPTPPPPLPPPLPPPPPPPTPPGCTYSVRPLELEVSGGRRTQEVDVDTTASCVWAAASNAAWIQILSGAVGTGRGEVRFTVDENPSNTQRIGTLTVAGQTVTVTQRK